MVSAMQSGQSVLRDMDGRIDVLRAQANVVAGELGTLTARRNAARAQESGTTRDLARLRLDLLQANQIASGIDAADQRALALLEQRAQALDVLNAAIAGTPEMKARAGDIVDQAIACDVAHRILLFDVARAPADHHTELHLPIGLG